MKLSIIFFLLVVGVVILLSVSGLGQGSTLLTFIAAFGLFMIVIFAGLVMFAKKREKNTH